MESSRSKRRRLVRFYIPQRSDLPAIFESLNDDTLTTVLEFVGDKSYRSFGAVNKHCKEIYLLSGMTKETFLYGYAPFSRITEATARYDRVMFEAVGKGVVLYNRRDVLEWALEERKGYVEYLLNGICSVAGREGRIDILDEVWNNLNDRDDNEYIFGHVDQFAAGGGMLNVLKWVETKALSIETKGVLLYQEESAREAAKYGQLHILEWLKEETFLKLYGYLYDWAIDGDHIHVMKWLREQGCPWSEDTFMVAVYKGNLEVLHWLQDGGCPWPRDDDDLRVEEEDLLPEVVEWCHSNGYSNRLIR